MSKSREAEEAEALVGDIDQWVPDLELRFAARLGMRLVLDLDADGADLVRAAARRRDGDYVGFARQAVLDAARVAVQDDGRQLGMLTVAEAAARFGVGRDRLQRAAMEGRLAAVKAGPGRSHPWLVRPEDVQRFLNESRAGPKRRASA